MNAIQFIKDHGVDKTREVVETAPCGATHVTNDMRMFVNEYFDHFEKIKNHIPFLARISDLNRLVESIELIEKLGGIEAAKSYVPDRYKSDRLKQAIADYESIGGEA